MRPGCQQQDGIGNTDKGEMPSSSAVHRIAQQLSREDSLATPERSATSLSEQDASPTLHLTVNRIARRLSHELSHQNSVASFASRKDSESSSFSYASEPEPRSPVGAWEAKDEAAGAPTTYFGIHDKVLVKRSSGLYTLGTVFSYDSSSQLYTICLEDHHAAADADVTQSQNLAFKRVHADHLRALVVPAQAKSHAPPRSLSRASTTVFGNVRQTLAKSLRATPHLAASAKVGPDPLTPGSGACPTPGAGTATPLLAPDEKKALRRVARLLTRARTTYEVATTRLFTTSFSKRTAPPDQDSRRREAILRRYQRGSCPAIVYADADGPFASPPPSPSAPAPSTVNLIARQLMLSSK
jgi:hypothetical protein